MIAKFIVNAIKPNKSPDGTVYSEELAFSAVTEKPFDPDGKSDDNDFAHWTPSASLTMTVNNPALFGTVKVGEKYYLTFSKAE